MTKKIIIAIDGYSSCGKSTLAKGVAKTLKYAYVDTGAMYRAVTLYCLNHGLIDGEEIDQTQLSYQIRNIHITFKYNELTEQNDTYLNGQNVEEEIRGMRVSSHVSPVSAIGFVRKNMVAMQQKMGEEKGVVMDGRDIGTDVFPNAELKIFLTADPEIRVQRRYDEMVAKKGVADKDEIRNNLKSRDEYDQNREESPLRQADDAIVLDNSHLTREQQAEWVIEKALEIINQ